MDRHKINVAIASAIFALFVIAYLVVWLSGYFDNSQYVDCYRIFVSSGIVLSYQFRKLIAENEE